MRKNSNSHDLSDGLNNLPLQFPTQFSQHSTSLSALPDNGTSSMPLTSTLQWPSSGINYNMSAAQQSSAAHHLNSFQYNPNTYGHHHHHHHFNASLLSSANNNASSLSPPSSTSASPHSLSPANSSTPNSITHTPYQSAIDSSNQLSSTFPSINLNQPSNYPNNIAPVSTGYHQTHSHAHSTMSDGNHWRSHATRSLEWDTYRYVYCTLYIMNTEFSFWISFDFRFGYIASFSPFLYMYWNLVHFLRVIWLHMQHRVHRQRRLDHRLHRLVM